VRTEGVIVRGIGRVVLALASVVIVAGCLSAPAVIVSPGAGADATFHESVVPARDDAIALEDAQQALNDYGDCLDGGELALTDVHVTDDAGFKRLDYNVNVGSGGSATGIADACYAKTFPWVYMLYQTQPAATQASDAKFEAALPAQITCLRAGGIPVDDASPADEVKQAMLAVLREDAPKAGDPGVTVNEDGSLSSDRQGPEAEVVSNCLYASDISGF
jgi:hypothetical protein